MKSYKKNFNPMKYLKSTLFFLPVIIFLFISITFYFALKFNNSNEIPSNLIKKIAPKIELTTLGGKAVPSSLDLITPEIKFVNFWASWCTPCRAEHPMLKKLAELNYSVIGINYKDDPEKALSFLDNLGDPYTKVGADLSGRNGLEWGLYGVPETFAIDQNGKILFRHAGPITSTIFENKFKSIMNRNP